MFDNIIEPGAHFFFFSSVETLTPQTLRTQDTFLLIDLVPSLKAREEGA